LAVDFLRAGFRAADFFLADVALAVRRFLVAAAFFPAATRFVDFLRVVVFLAVDFLRAGLRAVVFLAVDFLLAGLRAAVLAGLRAAVFFRVVFLAAERLAAGRLRAAVFLAAIPSPFPSRIPRRT
jgi:hypothetical protein